MTEPSLPLPDLQIFVRIADRDPLTLSFEARARDPQLDLNFRDLGSVRLAMSPKDYVHELAQDLSQMLLRTEEQREIARLKIEGKGGTLFEGFLPATLQALLWSLQGKISTLQVISDEPHIPWELMRLRNREGRRTVEGPFLCEVFALTRWLRGTVEPLALPVHRLALVMPKTSGLPASDEERAMVLALQRADREVTEVPARYLDLKKAFAEGDFDAWHFGGHGATYSDDPGLWSLELEDHPFRPEDMASQVSHFGTLRPLVFFNGCNTGRGGWALTGLGGWPQALLSAGTGAFLGALWALKDSKAAAFAQAFYSLFLAGEPIGEAVRQARLRVREQFPGDFTWLAYTAFAHPLATCSGEAARTDLPPLVVHRHRWQKKRDSPGALLRAEFGVVPFHGREREMEDLVAWCLDEQAVAVRLYTGPGGMGKTRLALEVAQRLRTEDWRTGFLAPEALASPQAAWTQVARPNGRVLAIVDYAETRREILIPLLRGMYETEKGPYRLILLARAALDWWEQLKAERGGAGALLSGPSTSRHSLPPLALEAAERARSYDLAAAAFSEILARPVPEGLPKDLDARHFERVLLLHMSALIAVEGGEKAKDEDGILDQILYRERRHWRERLRDAGLPPTFLKGVGRAMAAITLGGGVTGEDEALHVLSRLRFFAGQPGEILVRTARLLHECYPGRHWIEPILPDLLGEHLADREMDEGIDELFDTTLGAQAP